MAKHWIKGAIEHPGALHKELGVPQGEKIPAKKLAKAEHSDNPTLSKRAHLAETLEGMHHSSSEHHSFRPPASSQVSGYGHSQSQKHGMHRHSGNPSAHRLGHKG